MGRRAEEEDPARGDAAGQVRFRFHQAFAKFCERARTEQGTKEQAVRLQPLTQAHPLAPERMASLMFRADRQQWLRLASAQRPALLLRKATAWVRKRRQLVALQHTALSGADESR